MAECKVNKIKNVCKKWNCKEIQSENAMKEIQTIIDLKESEMPPCQCKKEPEKKYLCSSDKPACSTQQKPACPIQQERAQKPACPLPVKRDSCPSLIRPPCPMDEKKSDSETEEGGSCHSPGPPTINPFFNYMKELRETTCFNKTVVEVAKEAACTWRKMSECDKAPYIVEAYNVSRNKEPTSMKREYSSNSCGCPSKVRKLD